MEVNIQLFKLLHIMGFIAWYAGLFYLVKTFSYHRVAMISDEPEKNYLSKHFESVEFRTFKMICKPAMNLTWVFGLILLYGYGMEWFKSQSWMHSKLLLLILLSAYTELLRIPLKKLKSGEPNNLLFNYGLFYDIPIVLLVAIVSIAVFKDNINYSYLIIAILIISIINFLIRKLLKKS